MVAIQLSHCSVWRPWPSKPWRADGVWAAGLPQKTLRLLYYYIKFWREMQSMVGIRSNFWIRLLENIVTLCPVSFKRLLTFTADTCYFTLWNEMPGCSRNWEAGLCDQRCDLITDHRPPPPPHLIVTSVQKWSFFFWTFTLAWICDLVKQQNLPDMVLEDTETGT